MEYQTKDGRNGTFFNNLRDKTNFAIKKDTEERTVRKDPTKYYDLGKRIERPYFDIFEYKYGHTPAQEYKNGTSWQNEKFRPYPTNEVLGLTPIYVEATNKKMVEISGYETSNENLFKRVGRMFQ